MFDYEWRCHQAGLRYRLIRTIVFSSEYFKSVQKKGLKGDLYNIEFKIIVEQKSCPSQNEQSTS